MASLIHEGTRIGQGQKNEQIGHSESKATKPTTPNRGLRHRMVAWWGRLFSCLMLLVVNRC